MAGKNKPQSRKQDVVIQEHDGEVLIYDLRADKAFCLNSTAAIVWQLCDGEKNVKEISEHIAAKLKAKNSEDIVWLALDQLKKERLIDDDFDLGYDHFGGMSRREVVRKVAVGSAIAIPMIAGLVAPPAHAAGSLCGNPCVCVNNSGGFTMGNPCPTGFPGGTACSTAGPIPNDCTICHATNNISSGNQPAGNRAGFCSMT